MRSAENPYAGQGPVLLDVGGDVGAILVTMPAAWEGEEIEIRPQGTASHHQPSDHSRAHDHPDHDHLGHDLPDHDHLLHVEVLPRPTPRGFVHCVVFPELTQGRYELSERPFGEVRLEVTVIGGQVAQASWPPALNQPPARPSASAGVQ